MPKRLAGILVFVAMTVVSAPADLPLPFSAAPSSPSQEGRLMARQLLYLEHYFRPRCCALS